jgi:hypothetical protein
MAASVALLVSCVRVQAECIAPPPPCEALTRASVVVLATVMPETDWLPPTAARLPLLGARLRVVERFKGVAQDESEIVLSILGTAETPLMKAGQTYLVYARVSASGVADTACSRTREATADADEVRVLRQCVKDAAR